MPEIQDLHAKKYISLETYKKNNQPVRTPVWFRSEEHTSELQSR